MSDKLEELKPIAEAMARSLGHATTCPNLLVACNCGAGKQQAQALHDYEVWKRGSDA